MPDNWTHSETLRPPSIVVPPGRSKRFRVDVPEPRSELAFTFLYRLGMSFIALAFSAIPVVVWGALNRWKFTEAMVVTQGLIISLVVAAGEGLRSRAYAHHRA